MTKEKPYLVPGELYCLRGLKRNKCLTHLQAFNWGAKSLPRLLVTDPKSAYRSSKDSRLYTDGDIFLCIKVIQDSIYNNSKTNFLAYVLLTPDGNKVILPHSYNKGKFKRVK